MRTNEFRIWLNNPVANLKSEDSRDSYVSYLTEVEDILNVNIDNFFPDNIENLLSLLTNQRAEHTIQNYKSAVRKYFDFRNLL